MGDPTIFGAGASRSGSSRSFGFSAYELRKGYQKTDEEKQPRTKDVGATNREGPPLRVT